MTVGVDDELRIREYPGDDTATPRAYGFKILDPDDLRVTRTNADGSETLLVRGTHYTVSGAGNPSGGNVTPLAPIAAGTSWRIEGDMSLGQPTDYTAGDDFPAESHERGLDRSMIAHQEVRRDLSDFAGRAPMLPRGEAAGLLPSIDALKGKFPSIDALGKWYAAAGTGSDPALRSDMADPAVGPALFGWVQSFATAAVGRIRNLFDVLSDHLDIRDFEGADPTGATSSTAAFQAAIAEMTASKRPLRISRGRWKVDASLFPALTYIENGTIFGDGRKSTIIDNDAVGVSLFNVGNTYNLVLRDFSIEGNGLTGVAGNGHAIDAADPDINADPHLPGWPTIQRVNITGHRGVGETINGADMPACAIYFGNALSAVVDHCYFGNNGFGVYCYKAQQPEFRACAWEGNHFGGLINDQCENLRLLNPDFVGANDIDTGGTIHVGSAGAAVGGSDRRAGAVVDFFGRGSSYVGGKYKNHRYTGLSLFSPYQPLVLNAYIRQDDTYADVIGVYNAFGARIIGNEITYAGAAVAVARTGIKVDLQAGYEDFGQIEGNYFSLDGNGAFGTLIDLNIGGGAARMVGAVRGNTAGNAGGASGVSTVTNFIKVTGGVRRLELRGNHITAGANVTVTAAYNYVIAAASDEGLIDDGNSTWAGTGVITAVRVGTPASTGLQPSGNFKTRALQVGADVVVGARNTGWTAMTGTATKTALATYTAPVVSNPPTQAEMQALADHVQALSRRIMALDGALRAHGLIN